ncbi:MAG: Gfo/Idh/MocA family oxidoreductase [Acidobacteria bacterium]|nr:Gfo/Idh/MocA family oxidoreductase [Acidobacteriota bacterium]
MNRRTFVLSSAAAQARILGANDRVRVGIIGAGGRGRYLMGQFKEIGAEMAAVCDVYEPNLQAGLKIAVAGAKSHSNYHRLLDDKAIDAVIVSTPDHWHARMTIDAVEAGKDVYVEKPMAHTIDEGFAMIDAVRRTKRVVQVGTQRRSSELFLQAKSIIDSGQVGDVHLVTSQWMNYSGSTRKATLQGNLDWKQWLGTAPPRELDPRRFFNWYYYFDYSGGLIVGQAAHIMDCIQWFQNSKGPLAVTCTGLAPDIDGVEVTNTATILAEFPENYQATFSLGYKSMTYNACNDQLKQFHGTKARFDVGREWYALYPQSSAIEMKSSVDRKVPGSFGQAAPSHIRNFLDCIRSRKDPNAPVEAGQATNILLVMAMQSLREGRRLKWNAAQRRVEA